MKKAIIALVVVALAAAGGYAYVHSLPHPAVTQCEEVLKAHLKSPASYKPVSVGMSLNYITIDYDAANSYNALIRGKCVCNYDNIDTLETAMKESDKPIRDNNPIGKAQLIGKSPFDVLPLAWVINDNQQIDVPLELSTKNINEMRDKWYLPAGPEYITGWKIEEGDLKPECSGRKPSEGAFTSAKAMLAVAEAGYCIAQAKTLGDIDTTSKAVALTKALGDPKYKPLLDFYIAAYGYSTNLYARLYKDSTPGSKEYERNKTWAQSNYDSINIDKVIQGLDSAIGVEK